MKDEKWSTKLMEDFGVPLYIKAAFKTDIFRSESLEDGEKFFIKYPLNFTPEKKAIFCRDLLEFISPRIDGAWAVYPQGSNMNEISPVIYNGGRKNRRCGSPLFSFQSLENMIILSAKDQIRNLFVFMSEEVIVKSDTSFVQIIVKSKKLQNRAKEFLEPFKPECNVHGSTIVVNFPENVIDASLLQSWNVELMLKRNIPLYIKKMNEGRIFDGLFLDAKFPESSFWIHYPKDFSEAQVGSLGKGLAKAVSPTLNNSWFIGPGDSKLEKKSKGLAIVKNWDIEDDGKIISEPWDTYAFPVKNFKFIEKFAVQCYHWELGNATVYLSEETMIIFGEEFAHLILLSDESQESLKKFLESFNPIYELNRGRTIVKLK